MATHVLIPSYMEGPLLASCVQSARAAGRVTVYEGPIGDAPKSDSIQTTYAKGCSTYVTGRWESDAAKRTAMLKATQQMHGRSREPLWILWLDSDELLLWGEYLRDWQNRAEVETGAGGFLIRLVELDGSVVLTYCKIVRGDMIESYEHSINVVQLKNGMTISMPNVPICRAGGVPVWTDETRAIEVDDLARLRPPVHGEPHILHRTLLRNPQRPGERQSDAESRWYEQNDPRVTLLETPSGQLTTEADAADVAGNRKPSHDPYDIPH